jgi:glycosyltransferase involved in cell wall biosynthesis
VIPRFADRSGLIHPLRPGGVNGVAGYDRRILAHLPAMQLAPEFLAGCIILRRELVANFPDIAPEFSTLASLLRALMAWGRRLGYRAAIANHVVVENVSVTEAHPVLTTAEKQTLVRFFPDALAAEARFGELPYHRREALIDCALSCSPPRMLIDCSGMEPYHNGTSECILGILDGLAAVVPAWQIDIMAAQATADYHGLSRRYPSFKIVGMSSQEPYTLAVRLSQPWTLESVAELHERALHIAVLMLDTIAWDVVYPSSPEVERTWTFVASHADGLLYDSAFTRDRFAFRFPVTEGRREFVSYLSCSFDDYVPAPATAPSAAGHILLIGNDHEHKGMDQALDLLPHAFPDQQFVVIGHDDLGLANVTSAKSGNISAGDMQKMFAEARMLVFPSFYEGFGFPVVKGLAHGLDVVARRSGLLSEIAGQCAQRGRIVPFDDPVSLVDVVGGILAGEAVETLPLGASLDGQEPLGWRDIARRIITFLDHLTAEPSLALHDRREAALRHVWPAGYATHKASKRQF